MHPKLILLPSYKAKTKEKQYLHFKKVEKYPFHKLVQKIWPSSIFNLYTPESDISLYTRWKIERTMLGIQQSNQINFKMKQKEGLVSEPLYTQNKSGC